MAHVTKFPIDKRLHVHVLANVESGSAPGGGGVLRYISDGDVRMR